MSPARRQRSEGSVYKRASDGRWVGRLEVGVVAGKRQRKTVYAHTQREAIRKLRDARRALEAGDTNTSGTSLAAWLNYWLAEVCPGKGVKPKTLRTYRSYVEQHIVPAIGNKRLDKLTPADVRALHRYVLDKKLSSTTAQHAHRILGSALNAAMKDGKITRNVVALADTPPLAAVAEEALTLPQVGTLLKHLHGDRLQSRWAFALFTGARQGECLGLTWQHLNLDAGIADLAWQLQRIPYRHGCGGKTTAGEWACGRKRADRCTNRDLDVQPGFDYRHLDGNLCLQRPKTLGSTRVIPLPEPLVVALRERQVLYQIERRHYGRDHGLVWARLDGRPIDGRLDWAEWSALLEAIDVPHMKLHAARHSAATILQSLGIAEDIRMQIMGHSEAATQRRYAHTDMALRRAAMDTFGSAVSKALAIE